MLLLFVVLYFFKPILTIIDIFVNLRYGQKYRLGVIFVENHKGIDFSHFLMALIPHDLLFLLYNAPVYNVIIMETIFVDVLQKQQL